ncbi:MAG: hypothetical protein A2Z34_09805 [Planctomycetes bacterium RBG_16_59_8]|nr:MAG: hypothetical protein A2Z34_09805 [Planctomycetes bacterium RBG_16_59_8]
MTQVPPLSTGTERAPSGDRYRSFGISFLSIAVIMVALLAIQHLAPELSRWDSAGSLISLAIALAIVGGGCYAWRAVYKVTTTYHFAVAVIAMTIAATTLGTWIIQDGEPKEYANIYGESATRAFRLLFLHDIFHSLWFNSLLVFMCVSLLLVLVKRKFYKHATQLGFLFSHVGIVVILAGALVGSIGGEKGFIALHEGRSAKAMVLRETGQPKELGFAVKLDDFQIEYYDAVYKIYVYKAEGEEYRNVAATVVKEGARGEIPGTDYRYAIAGENIQKKASSVPEEPKHLLVADTLRLSVKVGQTYPVGDWQAKILQYVPHFKIDNKKVTSASAEPVNPALQVQWTKGEETHTQWLFANMPDYSSVHRKEGVTYPDVVYHFVDGNRPFVELELATPHGSEKARLTEGNHGAVRLEGGAILLSLEKRKDVKEYRSLLSIWEDGKKVNEAPVEVNAPLWHKGYHFYQSDYRKEDLTYSGISVVRDPGLDLVYLGLAMICFGVIYIFYVKPWLIRRRVRAAAGEA